MNQMHRFSLLILCFVSVMVAPVAKPAELSLPSDKDELNHMIKTQVAETYDFAGMALYLNQVSFFSYNGEELRKLDNENYVTDSEVIEKLIVVGRFNAMVIELSKSDLSISKNQLTVEDMPASIRGIQIFKKKQLAHLNPEFKSIRYHHLWWPLAQLSIFFEAVLEHLGAWVNQHWGLAILIFAILIKTVFIPLSIVTSKVQAKVNEVQGVLIPELNAIKAKYDGEEAHVKIMAAHKKLGVSPFFTLKPLIMTMIQIPFLIAIFNTLGEMHELKGAGFLWVADLSLPDRLFGIGQYIPMFGEWFNLLPFIMAGITLLATVSYGDNKLPNKIVKNQRMRLYLMASAFFVLFFPFPAAMVYYWSLVNLWQLVYQQVVDRRKSVVSH